ncbi:MAG: phosphoribosylformylglycinamidine synthase subunit PurS [Chloroflexi bacterium]|nr:phosphoribosylformylglycinamidine synthase subunit PurS [Chloroflexota bacterium]MCZ6891856.1 phosphoribosylformylglycinamidine synthase subunit PurS [Chloroflexota bacterium]
MFLAKIYVTLKSTVNDPQGRTVLGGLKSLGFSTVSDVRAGKYIQIKVAESDRKRAEAQVEEMCDKLLANPVIEEYRFELEEA